MCCVVLACTYPRDGEHVHLICRPSEEVFQALDDNQVTLATMKASRFVKPFLPEVDSWERKLSHVLEVMEMILQVQKQWMYLEVGRAVGVTGVNREWGSGCDKK